MKIYGKQKVREKKEQKEYKKSKTEKKSRKLQQKKYFCIHVFFSLTKRQRQNTFRKDARKSEKGKYFYCK